MMNIDQRILMDAIEAQTRQDMDGQDASRYPDDYFLDMNERVEPRPPTFSFSLKPDELALHQKLLEIAKANAPAPSESFFG